MRFGSSPEADSTHELCLSFTSALCFTLTDLWEIILTKQPPVRVLDCKKLRTLALCDFFLSCLFFLFLFLPNFIQDLSPGLVCTRWGWGFQTTTGKSGSLYWWQTQLQTQVANSQWEKVGGTQKIASEDEDVRKLNYFSFLICWIQLKDAHSPINKWPIGLLISIDPGSSTDTDIDWWPVPKILLIVSLKKKEDDKRIRGIRGEAKLYDPNGRKWKFPPPLNVGLHCAELCATTVGRDDAEDICITSVLS